MRIVGFEGNMPSNTLVSWGVAAVQTEDHRVLNGTTGRDSSVERFDELVERGFVTRLPHTLDVDSRHNGLGLVVVVINMELGYAQHLTIDTGRAGGLLAHRRAGGFQYYVFSSLRSYDDYANEVVSGILELVLFQERDPAAQFELVQAGLVVHSAHPHLNAVRVYLSGNNDLVRSLARASVTSPADRQVFEGLLETLDLLDSDYELVYEDGIAEGGGFDIDVAVATFRGLLDIHKTLSPYLRNTYSFLRDAFMPPRLHHMKAGSARLSFTAGGEGHSLGERLARVIEIRAIEAVLRGDVPDDLMGNRVVEKAVRTVVEPGEDTTVKQRAIGRSSEERLYVDERRSQVGRISAHRVAVLGFQMGQVRDLRAIEIRFAARKRVLVSTTDDGDGERPHGLDFLRSESDYLYKPAVFDLQVERNHDSGRVNFHLRNMYILSPGRSSTITSIASRVVDGAFLVGLNFPAVRRDDDVLEVRGQPIGGLGERTLALANTWFNRYAEVCLDVELSAVDSPDVRWIQPPRPPSVSALHRVVSVLQAEGGTALVSRLVDRINAEYDAYVRVNNTRREVYRNPDLLEFHPEDNQLMRLTERGQKYARILVAAGGRTVAES
jgi:hypothetical protein